MKRLLTLMGALAFLSMPVVAADLGGSAQAQDEGNIVENFFSGCGIGVAGGRSNVDVDVGGGNLGGDGLAGEVAAECTLQAGGAMVLGGRIAYGLNGAEGFGVQLDDYYYGAAILGIQIADTAAIRGLIGYGRQGVKGGPEVDAIIYGLGVEFKSGKITHGPEWQHWDYESVSGLDPSEDRFFYRAGTKF